jgi:hypothetical protein
MVEPVPSIDDTFLGVPRSGSHAGIGVVVPVLALVLALLVGPTG